MCVIDFVLRVKIYIYMSRKALTFLIDFATLLGRPYTHTHTHMRFTRTIGRERCSASCPPARFDGTFSGDSRPSHDRELGRAGGWIAAVACSWKCENWAN